MKGKEKVSRKKEAAVPSVFDEEDKKPVIIRTEYKKPHVQGVHNNLNFKVKGKIPMRYDYNYKPQYVNPINPTTLQSSYTTMPGVNYSSEKRTAEKESEGKREAVPSDEENDTTMPGVNGQEQDKEPNDEPVHVNLKVKAQDGQEVFFRVKRSTPLKTLMNAYCERQSVQFYSIAFLFNGRRLRSEHTPAELKMEDGDEIDAMLHQTGGAL